MQVAAAQDTCKLQFAVHLKEHTVVRQVCKDTGIIIQKLCVLANSVHIIFNEVHTLYALHMHSCIFDNAPLSIKIYALLTYSLTWSDITCKLYLIIFLNHFQQCLHYYSSNCRCLPTRGFLKESTSFVSMPTIVRVYNILAGF